MTGKLRDSGRLGRLSRVSRARNLCQRPDRANSDQLEKWRLGRRSLAADPSGLVERSDILIGRVGWASRRPENLPRFLQLASRQITGGICLQNSFPTSEIMQIMNVTRVVPSSAIGLTALLALLSLLSTIGCAGRQYGHLLASGDKDLVGSHAAGAATWNPLVDQSVAQLLSRCPPHIQPVTFESVGDAPLDPVIGSALASGPAAVCFVGIENKSAEELVDFKDQLFERIDSQINSADSFRSISRRMVEAALIETRLRPDSLFLPQNRDTFAAALGRQGTPVDYLLFATITTGTTDRNKSSQRDYVLTLELVNLHSGEFLKESAEIRKGYSKTRFGKWWNYGAMDQADG